MIKVEVSETQKKRIRCHHMMLEKTFKEMWGFLGSLDFSTATREV